MYVAQENQLLYPASWEYNAARILTELATIVENHDGRVKPARKARLINRTLMETKAELATREKISIEPITVTHTSYIRFVLDGYVYYYEISDNPFFDSHFSKVKVFDGKYSCDVYCDNDKKQWLYNCFLSYTCSNADVKEAANQIFNMLIMARPSRSYVRDETKSVPNIYNCGYHTEKVPMPGRTEKIDW